MNELILKGGPIMYVLILCSILGVYIGVQKFLFLRSHRISNKLFLDKIKHQLVTHGKQETIKELRTNRKIMVKGILAGIALADYSRSEIKERSQEALNLEISKLEKNMTILSSIITVAPILGLLGTVLGLMDIFNVISGGGIGDSSVLSAGIAKALVTTVAGLSIAIPFIFLKTFLNYQIESFIADMEKSLLDIASYCKRTAGVSS